MLSRLLQAYTGIACLNNDTEILGGYAKIFAWELARPRRYLTPIMYTRLAGHVAWVDLRYEQRIFANVRFVNFRLGHASNVDPQCPSHE